MRETATYKKPWHKYVEFYFRWTGVVKTRYVQSAKMGLVEFAVDGDGGAGDVAAAGGDEKRDERRQILGAAHVAEGDVPCELAHGLLGLPGHEPQARGVDEAGAKGVLITYQAHLDYA